MPPSGSDDVGRQPAASRSLCPWLVVLFLLAAASSAPATDAAALHCSNQSTREECVVAALRQARSDGRDIHAEYCRSVFPNRDLHKQSTTPDGDYGSRRFRVTHPYHPLFEQEFELVIYRQNWSEERVWFHDAEGQLISLPAVWTSVVAEDAFVAVSAGRSMFRVAELLELTRLIEDLKALKQRGSV